MPSMFSTQQVAEPGSKKHWVKKTVGASVFSVLRRGSSVKLLLALELRAVLPLMPMRGKQTKAVVFAMGHQRVAAPLREQAIALWMQISVRPTKRRPAPMDR